MNLNKTDWQTALMNAVTEPKELLTLLQLEDELLKPANTAAKLFPLKVPHSFIARMEKKNIHDPLLRQVLPLGAELEQIAGFSADPLQEATFNPVKGLLHKYHGRVLLTYVATCAINCRYCFRREFPYKKNNPGSLGWNEALDYIACDPSINEVILSGGDPLVANDNQLKSLIEKLALIPHVTRLRIHSRMPVVLPERITPEFIAALTATRLKPVMVIHCNHPQEINHDVKLAMQQLTEAGILLLNQSVLLKGVNDQAEILIALSEALFAAGVQPYYLHVLDKVRGTAHFDLNRQTAIELYQAMRQRLPGYLVPKLVSEQPGALSKSLVENLELCTD
jgi:EF-P beta-lysylation protein EpmB